ncbi:acyl-CoA dehydrogenase family protein [Glutamicibacter halophytocola]|uniref:Acyl-CoA/acyl-ACP dehydrogenase n=1 Tax=Glutamicibacter halophytocola TaxID=1933880 RepID=A0AA94Y1T3_9MICC|nr:acyl-CoA dehydrogenase family protein [Glutamicibacter halophytocola]ALG30828.1 acyl-CoA dehydrogenase [Glutamicibacter halophytocola]UUX60578.1 acyl-CoA/acyl-ACP dehydrogenase [Glutamicibacter halophytocola]
MSIESVLSDRLLEQFRERAAQYDVDNSFATEDFDALVSLGYLKALIPVGQGGLGWSLEQLALAQRRLATAAPATALAVNMHHVWASVANVLQARGDHRLQMVSDWISQGEVMAFGISEPGNDSVLFDSKTSASTAPDGSVTFNGVKIFTSLSPAFTRLGVFGKDETTGELVHGFVAKGQGLESMGDWNTLGMRASQSHTTKLVNAVAPREWVHSRLPAGPNADLLIFGIFASFLTLTASVYVGIADRAVVLGQEALNKKVHHDGTKYSQDIRARGLLAEAAMRLISLDALQRSVAADIDAAVDHREAWFPKLVTLRTLAGDAARENIQVLGQLLGGSGYFRGSEFERLYRDVQASWYHPSNAASAANTVASWLVGPLDT